MKKNILTFFKNITPHGAAYVVLSDQLINSPDDQSSRLTQSTADTGVKNFLNSFLNSAAGKIFEYAAVILGIAAVLGIIIAGIMYITSNGSPDQVKRARAMIMNTLYGIILAVSVYAIVHLMIQALLLAKSGYTQPKQTTTQTNSSSSSSSGSSSDASTGSNGQGSVTGNSNSSSGDSSSNSGGSAVTNSSSSSSGYPDSTLP